VDLGWTLGVVTLAAGLYALVAMRAEWRGEREIDVHRAPEWWPLDLPSWRALVRAGPMGAVEAPFAGALIVVSALEDTAVTQALEVVLTAAVVVTLALMVIVGLYNRPAVLVSPRLRAYPGALDEWNGAPVPPPGG
jgi:hypothetical protein